MMILIIFGNGVNCQVVLSSVTGVAASQQGVSEIEAVSWQGTDPLLTCLGLSIH